MKLFTFLCGALWFFAGCSNLPQASSNVSIPFFSIEHLNFGQITQVELIEKIGKPHQITQLKQDLSGKEAWIYNEEENHQEFQRLGLIIDRKTGIVESATWTVREGEPLRRKDAAFLYFKTAKLVVTKAGRVAPDYYSNDLVARDSQKGLSLYIDGASESVLSISFEPPIQRKLAKTQD